MNNAQAGMGEDIVQRHEPQARVVAVAASKDHCFSKNPASTISIIEGLGVAGDAHSGTTVKHRSRVAIDPSQPNLRQVHLIHHELLDDLTAAGFAVEAGQLGENITTAGIDLLALPRGTLLRIGETAKLEVTGLRNPCAQIEAFRPALLKRLAKRRPDGSIERLAGIMCIALTSGTVQSGNVITAELPLQPHEKLQPV